MNILTVVAFFGFAFSVASCNKDDAEPKKDENEIEFVLYSENDFSEYYDYISFTLSIRSSSNRILWDSLLPVMRVKDIPKFQNKLVIRKKVSNPDYEILKVGFLYYVDNVGVSWFLKNTKTGEKFKRVEFKFQ